MNTYFEYRIDEIYNSITYYKNNKQKKENIFNLKLKIEDTFRFYIYCSQVKQDIMVKHYNKISNIMFNEFGVEISI